MDRQISIGVPENSDLENFFPILEGRLEALPRKPSRLVRIFVSSTFSDMVAERNAMMEHCYPKLKDFCREKYGIEFQIMDLRWGIQEEAHNDHTIIDFCVREITKCKLSSIGPNFVALLGQKYGYRPFPPEISEHEFLVIRKALLDEHQDVTLLDRWFQRDTNTIPPKYCVRPIREILPDYGHKTDPEKAAKAFTEWQDSFEGIRSILRQGVTYCVQQQWMSLREREKYIISVTEYEILEGMTKDANCNTTCLTIIRDIEDLDQHLDHPKTRKFIDLEPGTTDVDREAQDLLRLLKDIRIKKCHEESTRNMHVMTTKWGKRMDEEPNADEEYIQRFCDIFYNEMVRLISEAMVDMETLVRENLVVEVIQHLEHCRMRCNIFRGRERILTRIKEYILGRSNTPLVLSGTSGSGKTSVIAKAASTLHNWFGEDVRPVLILRFLGTSARSTSIRLVLGNICCQIAEVYGGDIPEMPADYPDLIHLFHSLLKCATAERPLVVMLDSLDQLSSSHHAHNLVWLPKHLPPHARMLLSTLPIDHNLLATLNTLYPNTENFHKIQPLGQQMSMEILKDWLAQARRQLTPIQMVKVQTALHYCSLPLYTKLVFEEMKTWKSYDPPEKLKLETTIKGVINKLFDRIERDHGKVFVKHALSYITASRNGLGDTELEDTMSLDDAILNDVFRYWIPPIRRIPPLLWPRLLDDLQCYIVKREANGLLVNYWYHRQFIAVTRERYLSDQEDCRYIHSLLADYYLGTWAGGRKKPFTIPENNIEALGVTSREGRADRKVPLQPLTFGKMTKPPYAIRYNLRKISELPYHLIMSQRLGDLKSEILFNYKWLHTKLNAMSLPDILSDFRLAMDEGINDNEIKILSNSLRMGGSYVNNNPNTLAFDLLGHLLPFFDTQVHLRALLHQCDWSTMEHSSFIPIFQCFESPSEMLLYVLEEHSKSVVDLLFSMSTNELVSLSKDGTIAFWNLDTGEKSRTLDVSELNPGAEAKLLQSNDGNVLVCDSDSETPVFLFDMKTGRFLHKCGRRDQTQKRVFAIQNLLFHKKSIINMRTGKVLHELSEFTKIKQYVPVAITHDEKHVLIGENKVTKMYDLITKRMVASFPAENIPSVFKVTRDSRRVYAGYAEDCLFKVFDTDRLSQSFGQVVMTFNYQKSFEKTIFPNGSPYSCEVAEIDTSRNDQRLALINIKRCILIVIKVYDKSIADAVLMNTSAIGTNNNTFLSKSCFSTDGKYVIASEKNLVHIWCARSGTYLSILNIHSINTFPVAISPRQNLVATASNIHTAIKVWDIDKIHKVDGKELRIYDNAVDMVACAWKKRLLFVKEYYSLNSLKGYKHLDCFGLDVWNLSTGVCLNYLPSGQYGELKQMEVSPDGDFLVLLLSGRENTNICVINTNENKVKATLKHPSSQWFVLSHDFSHLATFASKPYGHIRLWCLDKESPEGMTFKDACEAVFTYDNKHLIVLSIDGAVSSYNLESKTETPLEFLVGVDKIATLPCRRELLLAIREGDTHCAVEMWNQEELELTLTGVAPGGLIDVSKDGAVGIDQHLQVFDLIKGGLITKLQHCRFREKPRCHTMVSLSYDGKYVVWVDGLSIKACRLSDQHIVANTSIHEEATSLASLDHGYFFVVGRKDGHVIPMKLVTSLQSGCDNTLQHDTLGQRSEWLLGMSEISDNTIETFDPLFQSRPVVVHDKEIPKASNRIQVTLAKSPPPRTVLLPRSRSRDEADGSPRPWHKFRANSEENLNRLQVHRGSLNDLIAAGSRIIRSVAMFGSSDNLNKTGQARK